MLQQPVFFGQPGWHVRDILCGNRPGLHRRRSGVRSLQAMLSGGRRQSADGRSALGLGGACLGSGKIRGCLQTAGIGFELKFLYRVLYRVFE